MYNDYMYAVDRSDEYLAHYGVKGMRWGVRKAIDARDTKALLKHYRKAQRKLAKLERRSKMGMTYGRRAAALGAGAAAAGGLALAGTGGVAQGIRTATSIGRKLPGKLGDLSDKVLASEKRGSGAVSSALEAAQRGVNKAKGKGYATKLDNAAGALQEWGNAQGTAAKALANSRVGKAINKRVIDKNPGTVVGFNPTNNTLARAGAAAVGAGLAAGAGYNAYRAATTKRAARQAQQFRSEMNKAFKGTNVQQLAANQANNRTRKRRRNRA